LAACARCYTVIPPGSRYCPNCGAPAPAGAPSLPLSTAYAPALAPAPVAVGGPPAPPGAAFRPPSFPLLPGETVLRQYAMDLEGFRRLMRRRGLVLFGIMGVIFGAFLIAPLALTGAFSDPSTWVILALPIVVLLLMPTMLIVRGARTPPSYATLTNRRVLVENLGRGESSAIMPLDNLSDVVLQGDRVAKGAGVQWVYLLPLGATQPTVGAGRARRAAPGVVWIPALRTADAEELRRTLLGMIPAANRLPPVPFGGPPPG